MTITRERQSDYSGWEVDWGCDSRFSNIDSSMYLYSVMRAFQTIIGVVIAWVINVKLLPYPPKPGSLSYLFIEKKRKKEAQKDKASKN